MHKYFRTHDDRMIAVRKTGAARADWDAALAKLTPIRAPSNASKKRASGEIATCRVLSGGRIGSI